MKKPKTQTFSIRICKTLKEKIQKEAKDRDRSMNYIIIEAIKRQLKGKRDKK